MSNYGPEAQILVTVITCMLLYGYLSLVHQGWTFLMPQSLITFCSDPFNSEHQYLAPKVVGLEKIWFSHSRTGGENKLTGKWGLWDFDRDMENSPFQEQQYVQLLSVFKRKWGESKRKTAYQAFGTSQKVLLLVSVNSSCSIKTDGKEARVESFEKSSSQRGASAVKELDFM